MNKKYSSNAGIHYDADAVVVMCKCLTFNNINISTRNDVIDSIEIKKGDIVALGGQTDKSQNGVYVSTGVHFVRHPLFNNESNMLSHIAVVTSGTYKNYRLYVSVVGTDINIELGAYDEGSLYQGVLDASAGIPYPEASEGMYWRISVAGVIGTTQVEVGDQVIAIADYAGGMDDTKFMIIQTNVQVTSVTYEQLTTLITNAGLEPGRQYLISDYVTAFNLFDGGTNTVVESTTGSQEPLLVKAVTTSTLDRVAQSWLYPQDIIYYNPYALAVDAAAFMDAGDVGYIDYGDVIPNFKGVIEFRHDTKQNVSTWYDFRNIKFRRWAVDAVAYDGGTAYVANDVCKSGVDGKIYKCITATTGEGDPTVNTADWILWWDITVDAYISWTTDNTKFNIGNINTDNLIFDPATYQDVYTFGSWYNHVNDVTIGHNNLTMLINNGHNTTLNNIVFKTTNNLYTCFSNEIDEISYNNTIGDRFTSNTIGNGFVSNIIGSRFTYNTIGDRFTSNTIGNTFYYNTIGNSSLSNTIGNDFSSNTIGYRFSSNTIVNSFSSNTIGNNSKVSAGINCQGNSIGDYNTQVTLGDNCTGISIGEKNSTITLGATNTNISIGNGNSVTTGAGCNGVTIHNDNSVVLGIDANGVQIGDGNAISGENNTIVGLTVGERNTLILGNNHFMVSIGSGNGAHSGVNIGTNSSNITIGNGNGATDVVTISGNDISIGSYNPVLKVSGTDIKIGDNNTIGVGANLGFVGGAVEVTIGNHNTINLIGGEAGYITIGNGNGFAGSGVTINSDGYGGPTTTYVTIGDDNETIVIGSDSHNITIGNKNTVSMNYACGQMSIGNNNNFTIGAASTYSVIGSFCMVTVTTAFDSNVIDKSYIIDATGTFTNNIILNAGIQSNSGMTTFANNKLIGSNFEGNTHVGQILNYTCTSSGSINGFDFVAATHMPANYAKTVFTNAAGVYKLSYFDALNALTVANVNA